MSSVPPTNSVQTSEPTFTTISARVIEGLSVLDRLPARGSFLAQIIEIKEPNLIKLSVGIKELKARINGNVPPSIKPNMTIKFHTTAQKNNIKLFLPEPENLVGSTKQRSNATDHNTAIKKGTKPDLQNTEIKVGNWIKAAIISNKNLPTVSETPSTGIAKDPELKKNILTNQSSSPMQKRLKSASVLPNHQNKYNKNVPKLIGFFIKKNIAKSLFVLEPENRTIPKKGKRSSFLRTLPTLGNIKHLGLSKVTETLPAFKLRHTPINQDKPTNSFSTKTSTINSRNLPIARGINSYSLSKMPTTKSALGRKVLIEEKYDRFNAGAISTKKNQYGKSIAPVMRSYSKEEIFVGKLTKVVPVNTSDNINNRTPNSLISERKKALFSLQEITAIKRSRSGYGRSNNNGAIPSEITKAILQSNSGQKKTIPVTDVRIVSIADNGSTLNSLQRNKNPNTQIGKIVAQTPSGQSILSIKDKFLILNGALKNPIGTNLILEFPNNLTQQSTAPRLSTYIPFSLSAYPNWSNLEELLTKLNDTEKTVSQKDFIENIVGKSGKNLTASLAHFLSAVRTGNATKWMGNLFNNENFSGVDRILEGLQDDFIFMQRASETSDNGWRGFFLPLLDDNQLSIIQFFIRHEHHRKQFSKSNKNDDSVQFLVELNLTNIGAMQIDGRLKDKELILVIRTRQDLKPRLQQGIERVFFKTLSASELVGKLTFKTHSKMPPLPIDKLNGYIQPSMPSTII